MAEGLRSTLELTASNDVVIGAIKRLLCENDGVFTTSDEWYETPLGMAVHPAGTNVELEVQIDEGSPAVVVHEVDADGEIVTAGYNTYDVDTSERWWLQAFAGE